MPGLPSTVAYVSAKQISIPKIAELALQKLELYYPQRAIRQAQPTISKDLWKFIEMLAQTSQILISDRDTAIIVGDILDKLMEIIEYERATIQLISEDGQRSILVHRGFSHYIDDRLLRPTSRDPLVTSITNSRKIVILTQTVQEPLWDIWAATNDVNSWIGVPLIFKDKVIGILTLDHSEPGFYNEQLRPFIEIVATYISMAIGDIH